MMPKELEDTWPCWRLWADHHNTWTELETSMSIDDVLQANTALGYWIDIQNDIQRTRK